MDIIGIIIVIAAMVILFKITAFILKIIGKAIGIVFGLIGYILLGVLAVFAFGMAMIFLPIIVVCGLGGIIALASRV